MFKKLKEQYDYKFSVTEDGIYIISVEASCNSGKLMGLFGGEDLRVEIDDVKLREIPAEKHAQYFNIPPAWNGTELKGKSKTVLFILKLNKGDHNIKFIPEKGAIIHEEPKVKLFDPNKILENIQSEERDRQPWITIALINLPLNILDVSVICEKRKYDSDDVKLIIDGKIQESKKSGWWGKNWHWQGGVLQGQTKEVRFYTKLQEGIHYIEFWADRQPILSSVEMDIGVKINQKEEDVKAKVIWDMTVLRKETRQKKQNVLLEIKRGDEVVVIERAIKGDRPLNSESEPLFSNRWHKVEYLKKIGYVYSEALEIEGEDEESIKRFIIKKSKETGEDECLMMSIARRESRLFPYMVSDADAQGLFQLKKIAIDHVNEEFNKKFFDSFDMEQNIEAGILYFQIVKKKYQNTDNFLEKSLSGWNRGMGKVGRDELFVIDDQPLETQQFIRDVFKYRTDCEINLKNGGKILLTVLLLAGVILSTLTILFSSGEAYGIPSEYRNFSVLSEKIIDINKDGEDEKIVVVSNTLTEFSYGITKILVIRKDGNFLELPSEGLELQWYEIGDFNKNGKTELAVLYGYSGSAGFGQFYLYEWNNYNFSTLISRDEINSKIEFKDLDNDGIKEISYNYRLDKWGREGQDIYKWNKNSNNYMKS